jgi:mono/diheme cytochrome c family protein
MPKGIKNVTKKIVQEKKSVYHIYVAPIFSIFYVFLTSCLAVFMIASCDNPTNRDEIGRENQSSIEQNAQINLKDIQLIYKYKCSICHGKNGVSVIKGAPDLVTTEFTMEERVDIIMNGKGTMPPQKDVLDMPTIRGLAVYIDSLK